jgi:hypothetical protein
MTSTIAILASLGRLEFAKALLEVADYVTEEPFTNEGPLALRIMLANDDRRQGKETSE